MAPRYNIDDVPSGVPQPQPVLPPGWNPQPYIPAVPVPPRTVNWERVVLALVVTVVLIGQGLSVYHNWHPAPTPPPAPSPDPIPGPSPITPLASAAKLYHDGWGARIRQIEAGLRNRSLTSKASVVKVLTDHVSPFEHALDAATDPYVDAKTGVINNPDAVADQFAAAGKAVP